MARIKFSEYRLRKWSVMVRWRDRKCVVCNTRTDLCAHHIYDKSYNPALAYNINNGVTLCRTHHILFHIMYRGSFKMKTTRKDWEKFMKIVDSVKSIDLPSGND